VIDFSNPENDFLEEENQFEKESDQLEEEVVLPSRGGSVVFKFRTKQKTRKGEKMPQSIIQSKVIKEQQQQQQQNEQEELLEEYDEEDEEENIEAEQIPNLRSSLPLANSEQERKVEDSIKIPSKFRFLS